MMKPGGYKVTSSIAGLLMLSVKCEPFVCAVFKLVFVMCRTCVNYQLLNFELAVKRSWKKNLATVFSRYTQFEL